MVAVSTVFLFGCAGLIPTNNLTANYYVTLGDKTVKHTPDADWPWIEYMESQGMDILDMWIDYDSNLIIFNQFQ